MNLEMNLMNINLLEIKILRITGGDCYKVHTAYCKGVVHVSHRQPESFFFQFGATEYAFYFRVAILSQSGTPQDVMTE